MKYIVVCTLFLVSIFQTDAQRREFHPTVDVGLNGGISFSEFEMNNESNLTGKLKQFNFNLMSNAGFSRHIFEVGYGSPLSANSFSINETDSYIPNVLSLNYTFGYELFAYYPACMIRNQLLLGLRLNTEFLFGDYAIDNIQGGNDNLFIGDDYGQYSADISLITDYHINKSNYVVLQVYSPLVSLLSYKIDLIYREEKDPVLASTSYSPDDSTLFSNFAVVGPKSEYFAIQLKYHGKLNSQTEYLENVAANSLTPTGFLNQNHHQIMLGIVGHFTRMPIGF